MTERVLDVRFDEANLIVDLIDGRTISAPLAWYPRLLYATSEQRANWTKPAPAMASIGPRSTRTSAPRACCAARRRRRRRNGAGGRMRNLWTCLAVALGLTAIPAIGAEMIEWPDLPKTGFTRGKPATVEDVERGDAVFSMNGQSKGALSIEVPQYVIRTDERGAKHPMILVQAELAPNGLEIVGLRDFQGGETAGTLAELTLLGTKKPN